MLINKNTSVFIRAFLILVFSMSTTVVHGQAINYSGKYKVKEGSSGELEVVHRGTHVSLIYRGDTYESELEGTTITGYAKQPRNYVGTYAECYDRIMADAIKAKAFRKYLKITFNSNDISGTIRIPRFKCHEDDTIEIIRGEEVTFKLNYKTNDLVYTKSDKIIKLNADNLEDKTVLISGLTKGNNLTVDQGDDLIFYQDGEAIYTANLDGSNKQKIITAETGASVVHMALDEIRNILFWTESYYIYRFDYPDGNVKRKALTERLQHPTFWLAVDTEHKKIYWSSNYTNTVYRSNYTGRDREEFTNAAGMKYINIDPDKRNLYCGGYRGLKRVSLDSREEKQVLTEFKYYDEDLSRYEKLNDAWEFVYDNEFDRLYFMSSNHFYKILVNREYQIFDCKLGYINGVTGYSFMSNKPVTTHNNPDNDFNIWTLINQ